MAINTWDDETPEKVAKFAKDKNLTYPIFCQGREVAKQWGIAGIPANYLFDRAGKLVGELDVIDEKQMPAVEAAIQRALK